MERYTPLSCQSEKVWLEESEEVTHLHKVGWEIVMDDDEHFQDGKLCRVCKTHAQALVDKTQDAFYGR